MGRIGLLGTLPLLEKMLRNPLTSFRLKPKTIFMPPKKFFLAGYENLVGENFDIKDIRFF